MHSRACPTPIGVLGPVGSDQGLSALRWSGRGLEVEASSALLACWHALAKIPYGSTVSYGAQARSLGLGPDAARAVSAANGRNPVPIVLPCHRVVGADGSQVGFGGGLELKRALIEHEARGLAGGAPVEPTDWPQAQLQLL